jgi:hypothetical protein
MELNEYLEQLADARSRIRALQTGAAWHPAPFTRIMEIMWRMEFFTYTRHGESFILTAHRENVLDTDRSDLIRLVNSFIRALNSLVVLSAADHRPVNSLSTQDRQRVQAVYNELVPLLDLLLAARGGGAPVPSAAALQELSRRLRDTR